ncbi:hypothetical protein CPJ18_06655 [Agrobacterium rosae]|uniref:Uncharacterized protein n=1 Tax=Agrobacterium rosae TaxID=1972867 RepID=A0AAE5S028_9HYPH|nr:hypothetical protein [Agrobacterium rosae]KAA3509586.1 hypothetical protein DXM21_21170 [Agrobacterium rosae]MDX8330775.1 hypothetical protein [Agrobacterium rosae]POO52921.1 hypothetical protein CPJ18_06655 [Agrobacterium rosae]
MSDTFDDYEVTNGTGDILDLDSFTSQQLLTPKIGATAGFSGSTAPVQSNRCPQDCPCKQARSSMTSACCSTSRAMVGNRLAQEWLLVGGLRGALGLIEGY